jgi:hypothetical protein
MALRQECLDLTWQYLAHYFSNGLAKVWEANQGDLLVAIDSMLDQSKLPHWSPARNDAVSSAWLSLFQLLYSRGHFDQARRVYRFAIRVSRVKLLRFRYLRKYIKLTLGLSKSNKNPRLLS